MMISYLAAVLALALGAQAAVGPSGIVSADGNNVQFSHDFASNIVLVGPSGIVSKAGNLQLTAAQAGGPVHVGHFIKKRAVVGPSGIVRADGTNTQFTQAQADNIVLAGPSGIVTKDGSNIQLTSDFRFANRKKRHVGFVSNAGNVGTAGILRADGTTHMFDHDTAHNIVLIGPSGIVTKNGPNLQFTSDLHIAKRAKRSIGAVTAAGNIGTSGILRADGTTDLFDHDTAHSIVLVGPSGIVTSNGRNMQLTSDLRIAGRKKRSFPIVGESGMILADGTQVQFKKGHAKIVLEGPSGILLSDGTLVQKKG